MGWVRDESGVSVQSDGETITLRQPYLLVDTGSNPVDVAMHPGNYLGGSSGNEPLPAFNSAYPNDPRLLLDAYGVNSDGSAKRIDALYSNNRTFRFPAPNVVPITGYRWRVSFETQTPEIPWTTLVKQQVATGVFRDAYLFLTQKMVEKVIRISIECRIKEAAVGNAIEVLSEQAGAIHKINGRYYAFEPSELMDAEDRKDYRANLSWVRPTGIPNIDIDTLPNNTYFPQVFSKLPDEPQEPWTKPPLHEVVLKPWPTDPSALPTFVSVLNRKFNPNGYAQVLALLP